MTAGKGMGGQRPGRRALTGATIFTGEAALDGHAVVMEEGRIAAVVPERALPLGLARQDLDGGLLAPGFVDAQVNGGGGVLFNDDPSPAALRTIAAAHRRFGTTGFLPTLVTDTRQRMRIAIAAVRQAMREGVPGALGIHLEGPFLEPERRGVHDPALIVRPEPGDAGLLASLGTGTTVVTLAPERVPPGFVAELVRRGVRVAAGHSAASYEETRAALAEGLSGFTHLFNAMPPLASRAPGVVGAALEDPESWCGLIVDGQHVHPAVLRVALAAKRRGRMMLVTDAMPPVGADIGEFRLQGRRVLVEAGRCTTGDGTLAGSALDMASAVRNAVSLLGVPVEEALRMASTYPAEFLGLGREMGRIAPGFRADLVLLDSDLRVRTAWIAGHDDLNQS